MKLIHGLSEDIYIVSYTSSFSSLFISWLLMRWENNLLKHTLILKANIFRKIDWEKCVEWGSNPKTSELKATQSHSLHVSNVCDYLHEVLTIAHTQIEEKNKNYFHSKYLLFVFSYFKMSCKIYEQ